MISCEDLLSDESDLHFESEVQQYVDSDKADSDIEVQLYSQIHFAEDISATTSAQSFGNNSSYIFDVSPLKSYDSLLLFKSKTEFPCDVKQGTSEAMKLKHFESSTPITSVKNNFITGKQTVNNVKSLKAKKTKKGKRVGKGANIKPAKSSEDSGCFESATCSDNHDGDHSDDSVVILEPPDTLTNVVTKEVILIDSSPMSDDVSFGRNSASPVSDSNESSKFTLSAPSSLLNTSGDLWHIDHEDRFSFIKKQKRYHEKHSSICNNCKKKGHLSKDCTEPKNTKCYICGQDHVWSMCHQRICGRCLEYGHTTRKCRYKAYELSCNLCKMRGHTMHDCPDLWRRYHMTTSPEAIVKGSKDPSKAVRKYCYNCGHEGHYGHECLRPRMSPDSFPTWPFVISYKDPYRRLKKHSKKSFVGESSNSSRHYDSYSRHKHNKKHRSHADELRAMISDKYPENSKKARNKDKKKFHDEKYSSPLRGNDFPRSSSIILLDKEGPKNNKKKRKRDIDKLYAFKRKKQKLNSTV